MINKKVITGTLCLAMGILLSNCANEELVNTGREVKGNFTLTASMGNSDTRTAVNDKYIMLWNEGDNIKVTDNEKVKATMELTAGTGTTTATFKGVIASSATLTYAIYPAAATYANKKMTYTFPATYANILQSNAPMYAPITSGLQTIKFQALSGILRLNFKNMPTGAAKTINLTSQDGNITGEVTADLSTTTPALGAPQSGGKEVTVTVPETTSADFFIDIPLPAGNYAKGIEVKLTGVGNTPATLLVKGGSEIKVGMILEMPDIVYTTINGDTPSLSLIKESIDDAETALNSGASSVTIKEINTSGGSEEDRTLTIPTAVAGATETPVFIGIESLTAAEGAPAIIKTAGEENAPKAVTVAIGSVGSPESAPSVTLEMPASTVTLGTTATTTTYNKVTATTAMNTLIIQQGVTVKELTVKDGNVVILGTVNKLVIDASAKTKTVNIEGEGSCYNITDNREAKATVLAIWDGTSTREPEFKNQSDQYTLIGGAAELAYLQLKNIPVATTGGALGNTITANTKLVVDIDLDNKPWAGMVLGDEFIFDGGNHTVSNVLVEQYALHENNIYTNPACVGLFAAAKKSSIIKDISVKKFTASGKATNAKWSGALVGYSYGATTYSNCKVEDVTIHSDRRDSYRVGGLIGFIAKLSSDVAVTLTDCSATNVNITAEFSVGGLVGAIQGAANRTFINCTTENVTLKITKESAAFTGAFTDTGSDTKYLASQSWAGYMSNFIGDLNIGSKTLTLTNCSATALTKEQIEAFGYGNVIDYQTLIKGKHAKDLTEQEVKAIRDEAVEKGTHNSLKGDIECTLIPAQIDGGTIVVDGTTLADKTDYNVFTKLNQK